MGGGAGRARTTVSVPKTCRESFLPLHAPAGMGLRQSGITLAGISRLDIGYRVCRADAHYHYALFTLAGVGHLVTEKDSRDLVAGDVLITPAHTTYTYAAREAPWHTVWFHLANNQYWSSINQIGFCVRRSQGAELLEHAMQQFISEALSRRVESDRLAELHAAAILAYLDREFAAGMVARQQVLHARLSKLRDHLNTDLARQWTVRDMAREAMLSPTHLTRLCRELFQTAPSHMLCQLRMQRARALLGETSFKLAMIAGMVGYGDTFAFSAAFKRTCGTSPSRFRVLKGPGEQPGGRPATP